MQSASFCKSGVRQNTNPAAVVAANTYLHDARKYMVANYVETCGLSCGTKSAVPVAQ